MKKFRKIMAVLVAALMIAATMVPAWAATDPNRSPIGGGTGTGTITINNAEDGETYHAYKIFDLYSFDDDDTAANSHNAGSEHYAYMIEKSSPWLEFVAGYAQYTDNAAATTASLPTAGGSGGPYFEIDNKNPLYIAAVAGPPIVPAKTYYFVKAIGTFSFASNTHVDDETQRYDNASTNGVNEGAITSAGAYNTVQTFARAAKAAVVADTITADYDIEATSSKGATAMDSPNAERVTVTKTGVDLGYYLIDSAIGTLVALDTTNTTATVIDKNLRPTVDKTVKIRTATATRDDSSHTYGDSTVYAATFAKNSNYEIGQEVTFLLKITVPKGAGDFTLHDVMEKGFTLKSGTIKVYAKTAAITQANTLAEIDAANDATPANNNYTITLPEENKTRLTDKCSFEIAFSEKNFLKNLPDDAYIEVEYVAYLNKDAYVYGVYDTNQGTETADTNKTSIKNDGTENSNIEGGPAQPGELDPRLVRQIPVDSNTDNKNTNSALLTFGDKSATEWTVATVETYQFDLVKTKEAGLRVASKSDLLEGAQFSLYRTKGAQNALSDPVTFWVKDNYTYQVADNAQSSDDAVTKNTVITTKEDGVIAVKGLQAGTYYLKESYAPNGFHVLDGYFEITIKGDELSLGANSADDSKVTYKYYNPTYGNDAVSTVTDAVWKGDVDAPAAQDSPATYNGTGGVNVINKSSTELPSTGGMGTTVLYIVGGMLVILAGAYLFFSRKRTA